MRGAQHIYRITDTTTTELAADLSATADVISVLDARRLTEPNLAVGLFGAITVNGERILYRNRNLSDNTLSGLRRGTAGTGATSHRAGTSVYDASSGNLLFEEYQDQLVKDTARGDGSTTTFTAPSINITIDQINSVEVYVGGTRQYNVNEPGNSQYRWLATGVDPVTIEFEVDLAAVPPLTAPEDGVEIAVVVRQARVWYQQGDGTASDGIALQETNTLAARFLRGL